MNSKSSNGFTLVELLVVVTIIVLLIAMLMPALGRAREQAKVAVCAANMHQLSLAHHGYTLDNSDGYPLQFFGRITLVNDPSKIYTRDGNGYYWEGTGINPISDGIYVTWDVMLQPYLNNNWKVLACPTDRVSFASYAAGFGSTYKRSYGVTLNTSWWQVGFNNATYDNASKESMYPFPSETVLITEMVSPEFGAATVFDNFKYWNVGGSTPNLGVSTTYRHMFGSRANFLYIDGHVEPHDASVLGFQANKSTYYKFPGYTFTSPTTSGYDNDGNQFVNIQQSFSICNYGDPYPGK